MKYLIVFSLVSVLCIGSNQSIVGKWQGVDKYLIQNGDTVDFTLDGKGYSNNAILVFYGNNTEVELSSETEFEYRLDGDKLVIGNRAYIVNKISTLELVLLEYVSDDLAYWSRFKKVEHGD
ncbi:MAG: hypothetical protein LAT68_17315 [Cyclobacteriaceae bacterium]|nr:hypothetical protein [Cyclobacteriaceae bacterium]